MEPAPAWLIEKGRQLASELVDLLLGFDLGSGHRRHEAPKPGDLSRKPVVRNRRPSLAASQRSKVGLVAKIAGHASAAVTLGHYTQAVRGGEAAIGALERAYAS